MGGDGINVKSAGELPPPGGKRDCGEDGSSCGGWRVGMAPSGRLPGDSRAVAHKVVHSSATGHRCGAHFLPAHICAVNGSREDSMV